MTNDRNGKPIVAGTDYVVIGPAYRELAGGVTLLQIGGRLFEVSTAELAQLADVGGGGVTDHGALTGLADDDHTQYHTDARGDARYSALGHSHAASAITNTPAGGIAATDVQAAINELDSEKAASSHVHGGADITSGTVDAARLPAATTSNQGAVVVGTSAGTSVPRMSDHVDLVDITSAGAPMKFTAAGDIPTHGQAASLLTGTILAAQMPAHTGDVTSSAGSVALTIAADAVTYAKMQNVSATDKVLGRSTAGAGDVEEIACTAAGRALIDDADAAAQRTTLGLGTAALRNMGVGGSDLVDVTTLVATFAAISHTHAATDLASGTIAAARMPALTGDVTTSAGAVATTIANNAVTYAKMQDVSATDKVLGRSTAGAGDVEEITCTSTARSLLDDSSVSAMRTTLGLGASALLTAVGGYAGWRMPVCWPGTANITTSTTVATTTTRALFFGKAHKAITSVTVIYTVTVAGVTITWAEVSCATGTVVAVGSPTLTNRGYTNVASVVNSTGIKTTSITTSNIAEGDDLWILFGNQASTVMQLRAGSNVDDLWSGMLATATARPSTMGAQLFTGGNENPVWCYALFA